MITTIMLSQRWVVDTSPASIQETVHLVRVSVPEETPHHRTVVTETVPRLTAAIAMVLLPSVETVIMAAIVMDNRRTDVTETAHRMEETVKDPRLSVAIVTDPMVVIGKVPRSEETATAHMAGIVKLPSAVVSVPPKEVSS